MHNGQTKRLQMAIKAQKEIKIKVPKKKYFGSTRVIQDGVGRGAYV